MNQIALAPLLSMPEPLQKYFLFAAIAAAGILLISTVVLAVRWNSAMPVWLFLAGFCSIALETVVTFLGHAVHPQIGNIAFFSAVNRVIPWHIALGYTVGFGLMNVVIWRRAALGMVTPRYVWVCGLVSVLGYQIFETAGVSTGLWVYFAPQPVWLFHGTAPLTWSFLDTSSMILEAALIVYFEPYLKGIKAVLIPVLGPTGAYMGHMGAGWPMYNVTNSAASPFLMQCSGVCAILLSLFIWWFSSLLLLESQKRINTW